MSVDGTAMLCAWFDLAEEGREDWYEWHNREHMPERINVPGFNRGRRFVAMQGTPRYFVMYEVDYIAVLGSDAYLKRLNHPTPWTQSAAAVFRNNARVAFQVAESVGRAAGGFVMTIRIATLGSGEPYIEQGRGLVRQVGDSAGVCAIHLAHYDRSASTLKTVESTHRGDAPPEVGALIVVEANSGDVLTQLASDTLSASRLSRFGFGEILATGFYQTEYCLTRRDLQR